MYSALKALDKQPRTAAQPSLDQLVILLIYILSSFQVLQSLRDAKVDAMHMGYGSFGDAFRGLWGAQ